VLETAHFECAWIKRSTNRVTGVREIVGSGLAGSGLRRRELPGLAQGEMQLSLEQTSSSTRTDPAIRARGLDAA
jgi:hypothetical protein